MGALKKAPILFSVLLCAQAWAGDIKWSGTYRFEGTKVLNSDLSSNGPSKGYMLHHLTLRPEIVAYDGLTIRSRFDIFNNSTFPNSQLGQVFGDGVNNSNPKTAGTNASDSDVLSGNGRAQMLAVNELYATWRHEFGALTVGRAPMHFGLGMNFNAGQGAFDHFLENRDLVAYKMVLGNFYVMPVIAKTYEGVLNQEDDVNDYILEANYENPETDLKLGVIYQARRSTSGANSNDSPTTVFGNGGTQQSNYEVDFYNFFVSQWVDSVKVAFEVGFSDGATGIYKNGSEVNQKGFGAALELDWLPTASNWEAGLDLGYASGDDPSTDNFEGYIFDQNYDVAFLLFNHPMGQADFFRTSYLRDTTTNASTQYDTEAISNALYASGSVTYKWYQKYALESRLTYAQLNKDPLQLDVDSAVGYEIDLTLRYEPFEGFQWINRAGVFLPGAAFEGGTSNFSADTAIGFETKAAISF
ncbi:MAG: hypothetical protein KDD33_02790 [Bdellovibrionales bacterium]|nr:hypothetical protein [Bdellovibrionales bacterium]